MDQNRKEHLMRTKCAIFAMFAIIGLISLFIALGKIKTENDTMCLVVKKWYDQLPEEHWIKKEDNKYINQNFFEYQLIEVYEHLKNDSHALFKLNNVLIGQKGVAGKFCAKAMETVDSFNERKFCLKNSENERLKRVNLKVGEECIVFFYYDDVQMLLDFSEEEYINEISQFEPNGLSLANRIVFSYSDNPEIATIFNGHIIGKSKGSTIIHFACNGYLFSYKIKVK